ncbi:hypothetical protein B296_00018302 [Ensete ventricosum]|uniref:Uncharacterized protein n=1 Tax=Ensete ventricosum TaxID=4639 RepID=A0A427AXG7_ENSVE|nr:hypothetical protein B296_00018302 [Ensete ventricosum]
MPTGELKIPRDGHALGITREVKSSTEANGWTDNKEKEEGFRTSTAMAKAAVGRWRRRGAIPSLSATTRRDEMRETRRSIDGREKPKKPIKNRIRERERERRSLYIY